MKPCPECNRAMTRDTSQGVVLFKCYCGINEPGTENDARIAGGVLNEGETGEMYRRLIANSAFDRTNQQVKKDCPNCGLDYLTQIRVGSREVVVWTCTCGYDSSKHK